MGSYIIKACLISEIIRIELINRHHNDPLVGHFGIKKIRKLVTRKYY